MNHRIFFYVNVTKTGSDGVLRKATEIAARSGYQCKVYEDASCMFADCIEEDEDEPACIVTIGGDGTTLRALTNAFPQAELRLFLLNRSLKQDAIKSVKTALCVTKKHILRF